MSPYRNACLAAMVLLVLCDGAWSLLCPGRAPLSGLCPPRSEQTKTIITGSSDGLVRRRLVPGRSLRSLRSPSSLRSSVSSSDLPIRSKDPEFRRSVLSHRGQYFKMERVGGQSYVEFGYTTLLDTKLLPPNEKAISSWIMTPSSVAGAMWDRDKISRIDDSTYKFKVFSLNFASLALSPELTMKVSHDVHNSRAMLRLFI